MEEETVTDVMHGYVPYPLAFAKARREFSGDALNPETGFGFDLLNLLRDLLDIPTDQHEILRLYSACETPLYALHGVSDWIELENTAEEKPIIVTIELVPAGERSHGKAEVVLDQTMGVDDENYGPFLVSAATLVVKQMAQKLNR